MAVGRISGPLLKQNLLREGVNLAFETDLLYLDVVNQRVGINNSNPQFALDVNGITRAPTLEVTSNADIGDININGNTISSTTSTLALGTGDNVIYQNKLTIDYLDIEGNSIRSNASNANIELRPNGTGSVEIYSDLNVTGDIYATGNITADGTITIGDANTDEIVFNAEVNSDIVPATTDTYKLGTPSARWADIWVKTFTAEQINVDALDLGGIDLTLRPGNIFYVAENGSDSFTGTHQNDPYATIKYALSQASAGDTVHIYPGVYTEEFPLTVPVGVTVRGEGLRSVTVQPTEETKFNDAFLMNGESTVEELTLTGYQSGGNFFTVTEIVDTTNIKVNVGTAPFAHTYVSGGTIDSDDSTIANVSNAVYDHTTGVLTITTDVPHDTYLGARLFLSGLVFSCNGGNRTFPDNGYGFRFATDFEVTTRSPYIRNVTVITSGTATTVEDPRGFNTADAGKGAYVDGAYATAASKEAAMLFHAVTFITPGVDGLTATNGTRIEWLNSFTYFANRGLYVYDSNDGLKGTGKTALRVGDVTGSFAGGETIEYYDTDGVTLLASGTIASVDADDKFYITGKTTGFELPTSRSAKVVGAVGSAALDTDIKKFGTASLELDGNGGIASSPQSDFGFGTGDFTVEMWVYLPTTPAEDKYLLDLRAGVTTDVAPVLYTNNGDLFYYADSAVRITGSSALSTATWHHIALARSGSSTKLFVDGTQVGSTYTDNNDYGSAKPLLLGTDFAQGNGVAGYIDDFRVQKANAEYTSNFTAPTANLYSNPTTVLLLRFNGEDSSVTFEDITQQAQDIRFSGGASATEFTLVDYTDFGAEVRMIGSAAVYGNYGLYGDGPGVIVYAIGQNLAYIGNGKEVTNDVTTVIQANEIVELNGARIRYNSVDHKGDFRVGDLFYVNQDTGEVTFTASGGVDSSAGLSFSDGANTTTILPSGITTGNWSISGNTIETVSGDANFAAGSNQINFNSNVFIDGDVDVTGDLTLAGDITIGDEATDSLEIIGGINSNVVPSTNSTYSLGTPSKQWQNVYTSNLYVDDVRIHNNFITTTASNADLELRASGTGVIKIDDLSIDNFTISSTNDIILSPLSDYVKIDSTGAIKIPVGDTVSRPSAETGLIRFNTDLGIYEGYNGTGWIQLAGVIDLDGDTKVTAELTPGANDNTVRFDIAGTTVVTIDSAELTAPRITVDDIEIDTNVITTVTTNQDLELAANGTGSVILENFAFRENTITNIVSDSVTTFTNSDNGYVKIAGTNGFVIPVGDNTNRPDPAFTETGMMRFNTADGRVEVFDGATWSSTAGATGAITRIDAEFLAVETVLHLG
jgi:hypothetical protein